jgi:outer membrane protein TolC
MLNAYRRCLLLLGLGAAVAGVPLPLLAAPEPAVEPEGVAQSPLTRSPGASLGGDADDVPTLTLEPGEEAVPLHEDEDALRPMVPTQRPIDGTIPQSDRPTDEGFDTPPDALVPSANPLLTPTTPEEVEILGTQPISLDTAIELAYRNSEELRIALLQVERSQEGLRAEQAALYPTANFNANLESSNQVVGGQGLGSGGGVSTRLGSNVRAEYDLGLSGARSARIRGAEEQVRLAELSFEQVREDLRLGTTTDYYAVQEAIEQIRINQGFLAEAERNLRDTQLRQEVGVGTRFDVLQAEVQVANARQALTQSVSQRQIAQRQLARRLNVPPTIDLTTLAVAIAGSWPLSLEDSIVQAFQNRSELEQALVERSFNETQRQLRLAQLRPNLGLFAQYGVQTQLTSPTGSTFSLDDGFSVGAQFSWPLFDGGATRAQVAQSELDIQIDEAGFANSRNTIRLEVEEAYYTLVANQANIETARAAENQARQALELANLRFNAGVGTQLDVISATRELTEAQGNLVRAVLDYNRALARLERSVSNVPAVGN